MRETKEIRVGVFGLQHEEHARGFMRAAQALGPQVRLVAAADSDERYRNDLVEFPGVTPYADAIEMLERERPEIVFVDTINSDKAAAICQCLRRGIAVLANKPLCTTVAQLERVADALIEHRGVFSLQLTERFNPVFVAMKKAIDDGMIGAPVVFQCAKPHRLHRPGMFRHGRPAWMFDKPQYGSVMIDLGIHDVDLVRWMSGREVQSVSAVTGLSRFAQQHPDFTDYAVALLNLSDGAAATVEVDWLHPMKGAQVRFVVYGTEGFATFDASLQPGELVRVEREGQSMALKAEAVDSIHANGAAFIEAVRAGKAPTPTARDSLIATMVTLCADQAAAEGRIIPVAGTPLFHKLSAIQG